MKEEWKQVKGYEGLYEVSSLGRIRGLKSRKLLKYQTNHGGYLRTFLFKDAIRKSAQVHRVVCEAFHLNPLSLPQVNHINADKTDNRAVNLEWCNASYNIKHAYSMGLYDHCQKKHIENSRKEVWKCDMKGIKLEKYYSLSEAARIVGLNVSNISACCHGRIKSTGGFKWVLASDR